MVRLLPEPASSFRSASPTALTGPPAGSVAGGAAGTGCVVDDDFSLAAQPGSATTLTSTAMARALIACGKAGRNALLRKGKRGLAFDHLRPLTPAAAHAR